MAVTSGFFNSINHDRTYDSVSVSELFDGVIEDGVFMHIGEKLKVYATSEPNTVEVGTGRCWFDHAWVKNGPGRLTITLPDPETTRTRIDAIIVEIDHRESYRSGTITYLTGPSNGARPTLKKHYGGNPGLSQYPLAYITRYNSVTTITQAEIDNRSGFEDCPWVVAPAGIVELDDYWAQWEEQFGEWLDLQETNAQGLLEYYRQVLINKTQEYMTLYNSLLGNIEDQYDDFEATQLQRAVNFEHMHQVRLQALTNNYNNWFSHIRVTLGDNDAADLYARYGVVQADLDTLAKDQILYRGLQDSGGIDFLLDDSGDIIEGGVKFQLASSANGVSGDYVSYNTFNNFLSNYIEDTGNYKLEKIVDISGSFAMPYPGAGVYARYSTPTDISNLNFDPNSFILAIPYDETYGSNGVIWGMTSLCYITDNNTKLYPGVIYYADHTQYWKYHLMEFKPID